MDENNNKDDRAVVNKIKNETKKEAKEKINAKNNCIDITSSYFDSYLFISNRSNYGCCIYGYKLL